MKYKTTTKIFIACVLLQVIQTIFPKFLDFQCIQLSDLMQLRTSPRFLYTIIVHMFSHASWSHLWGNFMLGLPCMCYMEHRLSSKMLSFYVIMGLGALATALLMPIGGGSLVGSSGAIFGCLAASCMLFPNRRLGMLILFLWLLPELAGLSISLMGSNVSHAAHLGGALTAILYCHIVGMNDRRRSHKAIRRM